MEESNVRAFIATFKSSRGMNSFPSPAQIVSVCVSSSSFHLREVIKQAEDFYKVSASDIVEAGGQSVLNQLYASLPLSILQLLYPSFSK